MLASDIASSAARNASVVTFMRRGSGGSMSTGAPRRSPSGMPIIASRCRTPLVPARTELQVLSRSAPTEVIIPKPVMTIGSVWLL